MVHSNRLQRLSVPGSLGGEQHFSVQYSSLQIEHCHTSLYQADEACGSGVLSPRSRDPAVPQ